MHVIYRVTCIALTLLTYFSVHLAQAQVGASVFPAVKHPSVTEAYQKAESSCAFSLSKNIVTDCGPMRILNSYWTYVAGKVEVFSIGTDVTWVNTGETKPALFFQLIASCPNNASIGDILAPDPAYAFCTCTDAKPGTGVNLYYGDVKQCVLTPEVAAVDSDKPINSGCPGCSLLAGDPINVSTGNSYQTHVDLNVAAPSSGLQVKRAYNSFAGNPDANVVRSFGMRWTQRYDVRVTALGEAGSGDKPSFNFPATCWKRADTGYKWCEYPNSDPTASVPKVVEVMRSNGKGLYFTFPATGPIGGLVTWIADTGVTGQLTSIVANDAKPVSFTFTDVDNHIEKFDANGLLLTIQAPGGSIQNLTYSTGNSNDSNAARYPATSPACSHVQDGPVVKANSLLCVTDSWGRQLQFEYDAVGRITKAIDPN